MCVYACVYEEVCMCAFACMYVGMFVSMYLLNMYLCTCVPVYLCMPRLTDSAVHANLKYSCWKCVVEVCPKTCHLVLESYYLRVTEL